MLNYNKGGRLFFSAKCMMDILMKSKNIKNKTVKMILLKGAFIYRDLRIVHNPRNLL